MKDRLARRLFPFQLRGGLKGVHVSSKLRRVEGVFNRFTFAGLDDYRAIQIPPFGQVFARRAISIFLKITNAPHNRSLSSSSVSQLHEDSPLSIVSAVIVDVRGWVETHATNNDPWPKLCDEGTFTYFGSMLRSVRSFPRFIALPSYGESSQYDRPSCNAFRPAKEFVPPWQVVSSACAFFYAGFLLFRCRSESGAIFCAVVFILLGGAMLLVGHERYEDYAPYKPDNPKPELQNFLHYRENVSN